jgi:hypothetical protein
MKVGPDPNHAHAVNRNGISETAGYRCLEPAPHIVLGEWSGAEFSPKFSNVLTEKNPRQGGHQDREDRNIGRPTVK